MKDKKQLSKGIVRLWTIQKVRIHEGKMICGRKQCGDIKKTLKGERRRRVK